jgi:hypothetical protein
VRIWPLHPRCATARPRALRYRQAHESSGRQCARHTRPYVTLGVNMNGRYMPTVTGNAIVLGRRQGVLIRTIARMSVLLEDAPAFMTARTAVLAFSAASLLGCTSAAQRFDHLEQCSGQSSWHQSPAPPANRLELLELDSGGSPVRERLSAGVPLREAWFADGSNRLMVCRYEDYEQVCPIAITVEFTRASNVWSAGSVQSRTCQ